MILQAKSSMYVFVLLFLGTLIKNLCTDSANIPTVIAKTACIETQKSIRMGAINQFNEQLASDRSSKAHFSKEDMLQTTSLTSDNLKNCLTNENDGNPSIELQFQKPEKKNLLSKTSSNKVLSTSRLLTTQSTSILLSLSKTITQSILQVSRYLLFIGLFTNTLDVFLPFIIFSESFLMFGFLNCGMYTLKDFYYNIFNSKVDIMNAIRIGVSSGPDQNTLAILAQYNFSSNILSNIAGEIIFSAIFLCITIFLKVASIFTNSQRVRYARSILRGLWNGFFIGILPRVATFTGFHLRNLSNSQGILGFISSIGFSIVFVLFFIQLLLQTRSIVSKIQYVEDSKLKIGLASRIDHTKTFQFDCLSYSMLYYPLMNYFRLAFLFFLPIGAFYDLYYVSFGGPILSQLIIVMLEVSSPGYSRRRDRILCPINNFLLMLMQLGIISVGLAESVSHSEISEICLKVIFSLAIGLFISSAVLTLFDFKDMLVLRCSHKQSQEKIEEDDTTQKIVRRQVIKNTVVTEDIKENQSDIDDYCVTILNKKTTKVPQLKIKKVRRGRII